MKISELKIYPGAYLLLINQFLGAFPVEYSKKYNRKSLNLHVIYSLFMLMVYFVLFVIFFPQMEQETSTMTYFIKVLMSISTAANLAAILLTNIVSKNNLINVVEKFKAFDGKLSSELNYGITYKKSFYVETISIILTTIIITEASCFNIIDLNLKKELSLIIAWILFFFSVIVNSYHQLLIFLFGFLLYQRFSIINKLQSNVCQNNKGSLFTILHKNKEMKYKQLNQNTDYYVETMKSLRGLNIELRNLANNISSSFSFSIFLSTASAFLHITVKIFKLLLLIRSNTNKFIWIKAVVLLNDIIVHSLQVFIVVLMFYLTKKEVIITK